MNWDLDDGVLLVRSLQSRADEFGYHITLGGSVLTYGESEEKIDLYFLPLNTHPETVGGWLAGLPPSGGQVSLTRNLFTPKTTTLRRF